MIPSGGLSTGLQSPILSSPPIVSLFASAAAAVLCVAAASPAGAQAVPTPDPRQWGLYAIHAPDAWAAGFTGAGVTVAIGDSGIDVGHPAFTGKIDPRSRNFVPDTPGGVIDPTDLRYVNFPGYPFPLNLGDHGVHMAGVIMGAGTFTMPGVAYDASAVVMRDITGGGIRVDAAIAYFAGLSGVNVMNLSYGGMPVTGPDTGYWPTSSINPSEAAAALSALAAGKVIVSATGNDRFSYPAAGLNPRGPSLMPFIQPANARAGVYDDGGMGYDFSALQRQPGQIVSVTAIDATKKLAIYANACGVAASWCLSAPGGSGNRELDGIWAAYSRERDPSGYGPNIGTSESAAFGTGSMALLMSGYPDYTAKDIAHVLFTTAENLDGQPGVNARYGYGLIRLDRATQGPTSLAAGAAVDVGAMAMTYWSRPLTTGGAFDKTGDGALMIAGRTIATGDVTVQAGALGIGGTLTVADGHRLIVGSGGTLSGFGWIVGDTLVNGHLRVGQLPNYADLIANNGGTLPAGIPLSGTSPGTLTFRGDVTLGTSAAMYLNVDGDLVIPGGPRTYDKVFVEGAGHTFTAGGTLMPVLRGIPSGSNSFSPALGQHFQVITAEGGVLGSFAGLVQPLGLAAGTRFDALYGRNTISLVVTPQFYARLDLAGLPAGPDIAPVGAVFDALRPAAGIAMTAELARLFAPLYPLSGTGVVATLSQLSPTIYGDTLMARRDGWHLIGGAIDEQLAARRGLQHDTATRTTIDAAGNNVWLTGLGQFGDVTAAYSGWRTTLGGVAAGIDRAVTADLTLGAAFGYLDQSVTARNSASHNGQAVQFSLYGSLRHGAAFLETQAGAGFADGNVQRVVSVYGARPNADVSGASGGGALRAGLHFKAADWRLEPSVALSGVVLRQGEVVESGAGWPRLMVDAASLASLRSITSVRAERRITLLTNRLAVIPSAEVGWLHEYLDTAATTTASFNEAPGVPFTVRGADIGRDAALLKLRATFDAAQPITAHAGYTSLFNGSSTAHVVTAGVRVVW